MNRRTRALASLAIALMAAFLSIAPAVAQDATPVAEEAPVAAVAEELRPWVVSDPFTPAPDECTVDAVDVSSLAVSLATPIPVVAPDLTSAGIYALEVTGLADAATIDGVLDTLTLFWACTNAGNRPAVAALMTPAAVSEFYGIDLSLTGDALDEEVANRLVNSGDREEGAEASIDGVLTIAYLGDGRTGALVLNTDPFVNNGLPVLDLFVFANVNGVYQVDSVIFDPFDLTPGYGFEIGQ
ncbi:MAG: hypothetical protein R2848_14120 [Thermomicrobiales bacterium]